MATTTVQIRPETKKNLDDLKIHPRETYDGLIGRLAEAAYDDEEPGREEIAGIRESEKDIRAGRTRSLREILKDPGDDWAIRSLVG